MRNNGEDVYALKRSDFHNLKTRFSPVLLVYYCSLCKKNEKIKIITAMFVGTKVFHVKSKLKAKNLYY